MRADISDGDSLLQTEYTNANNEKHKSTLPFTLNEILVESAQTALGKCNKIYT